MLHSYSGRVTWLLFFLKGEIDWNSFFSYRNAYLEKLFAKTSCQVPIGIRRKKFGCGSIFK